jgi:enoyl-[acyl-carrier protein] reductase II
VRFETWGAIMPADESGYDVVPRVIRTDFVARWERRSGEAGEQAAQLRSQIMAAVQQGRPDELTPFTGQTAGLIDEVLPAAEIVRRMVSEAEEALERVRALQAG